VLERGLASLETQGQTAIWDKLLFWRPSSRGRRQAPAQHAPADPPAQALKDPKKAEPMTPEAKPPQPGAVPLPGVEQRRSQRVVIRIPVTLEPPAGGVAKVLRAHTVSVNDHGALLIASQSLAGGTKVSLKNDRTGEQQACHVVRNSIEIPDGYHLAIEFDVPAKGFWHISFPPLVK
jgi:hypothetical protein